MRLHSVAIGSLVLALFACSSATVNEPGTTPGDAGGGGGGGGDTDGGVDNGDGGGAPGTDAGPGGGGGGGEGGAGKTISYTNSVSVIVEPSDNGAALLAAVKAAKKSVHVTMYLFTDTTLEAALAAQSKAGVDVEVCLNMVFPAGQGNGNSAAHSYFVSHNVKVAYAPTAWNYTHQKTIIIDGTTAWIMTMNTTQSSASTNREFLALDTDAQDVADAEQIFQADFTGKGTTVIPTKLVVSPTASATIDARTKILAVVNSATKTLDVGAEELSDYTIVNALIAQHKAGVTVQVVVSGSSTPSASQTTAVSNLKAAGIVVKSLTNPDMHAKAILADEARAYMGSQNFTDTSLTQNRELGILTDNATEIAKMKTALDADFAAGTTL
jgi:phosphatidylserine/phosphatidylglycerophosphate/cardiolipin synthase-like enzyme